MRHSEYTAYFRQLATEHPRLRHSQEESHFARIVLSRDEFGHDNLTDLISGLRSRHVAPVLVLVAYDHTYANTSGDQRRKVYQGAFIVLDKPAPGDFDAEEASYDITEQIGEQILARVIHDLEESAESDGPLPAGLVLENELPGEKIGKVHDFVGTRFGIVFWKNYNGPLYHNPDNWIA